MLTKTSLNRVLFVRRLIPVVFTVFTFAFTYWLALTPSHASAATTSTINFQAKLMAGTGAIVPDGNYNVEFKLYNTSSSSGSSQGSCTGDASCLWTETRTTTNQVRVVNGYLTVSLGSVTSFPTTINWDQGLWLTMNIGGTGGTPTWDGEMSPRLQLTAVPYAFRAGQLAQYNNTTGFTSTLNLVQPTGGNQIFNIPDQGAAGTYSLLTTTAANAGYIQLQGSTPGTAQTGNFNITGTGIAGVLQAPSIDAVTAGGTLALGGTNSGTGAVNIASGATTGTVTVGGAAQTGAIQIGVGTGVQTLNLGTGGTGAKTITIGSTASSSSTAIQCGTGSCTLGANAIAHTTTVGSATGAAVTNIQGGNGSTAINLTAGTNGTINATTSGSGKINLMSAQSVIAQSTTNSNIAFQVQNSSNGYVLNVDTQNNVIGLVLLNSGIYGGNGGYLDTYNVGASVAIGNANAGSVVIGNTSTSTTVNVQGGTGASAISLAPATNGSIAETTTGTGTITLSSATGVTAKGSSATAFQVQNASGTALLNYSTTQGMLTTYGGSLNVNGVAAPTAPSLTSTGSGGSLAAHTYYYRLDAIGTDNSSTTAGIASSPGSVTTTGSASKNTLSWTAVPYATGYDVYRSIDGGNTWFVNTVSSSTTTIVDNGTTYTWATGGSFSNLGNAGGLNLQRGTGLTLDAGSGGTYQMEIFDNVNGGDTLTMGNYNSGGTIDMQAQNFYITDTSTFNHDFALANTGAVTFKSSTASLASAFVIQNSTGVNMFNVNTSTTSERITIGPSGGDTVGEILVLGVKTGSSTDPTGINGAMYYNSTSGLFRCYQNSEWRNCVSSVQSNGLSAAAGTSSTTSTSYSNLPAPSSLTFTKSANGTKLLISVSTSWRTSVNPSATMLGLNISGTDYDCTRTTFNAANAHQQISCSLVVSSIPAGSVTVQLRWKIFSGTSPTLNIDTNDWVSISVLETD